MSKKLTLTKKHLLRLTKIHLFVLLLLITIAGITAFTLIHTTNGQPQSSVGVKTIQYGEFKTFTSQDLGISFDYAAGPHDQRVLVKEIGSKVYLYVAFPHMTQEPAEGKFVEVFSKDPNQSLTGAVRDQFLQGYSPSSCPIVHANLAKSLTDSAREYLQITTPQTQGYDIRKQLDEEKLCPSTYTFNRRTGTVYFMMDPKHSDKFVFFSLGQDNFWGTQPNSNGIGLTWDQTLKFLDK
jgi:hypothetical protein